MKRLGISMMVWSAMQLFVFASAESNIIQKKFDLCFARISNELARNEKELAGLPIIALENDDADVLIFLRDKLKIAPGLLFGYGGYTYDAKGLAKDLPQWKLWFKTNKHLLRFDPQQGIYLAQ